MNEIDESIGVIFRNEDVNFSNDDVGSDNNDVDPGNNDVEYGSVLHNSDEKAYLPYDLK